MGAGERREACFSQASRPGIAYFRSRESANALTHSPRRRAMTALCAQRPAGIDFNRSLQIAKVDVAVLEVLPLSPLIGGLTAAAKSD
jgi:hypothetical protein